MKYILICAFALGLAACHDNPYDAVQGTLSPLAPKPKGPVPNDPKFQIIAPILVEMTEGVPTLFPVAYAVQPGQGQLTLSGLPNGAQFDTNQHVVSWTPPAGAGVDPANAKAISRSYVAQVSLTSTDRPGVTLQQAIEIKVYHPSP